MLLENFFWKKSHDFIAEAAKAFMLYFEVLPDGFVKIRSDADLVFCWWVLDLRTKTFEKLRENHSENVYRQTNNYRKK